jgi:hypothetical protein
VPKGRSDDRHVKTTMPIASIVSGNRLFEGAVAAIGLDQTPVRRLLRETLEAVATTPGAVTPDELGGALPEVERRVRMLATPEIADAAINRLRRFLINWEE